MSNSVYIGIPRWKLTRFLTVRMAVTRERGQIFLIYATAQYTQAIDRREDGEKKLEKDVLRMQDALSTGHAGLSCSFVCVAPVAPHSGRGT